MGSVLNENNAQAYNVTRSTRDVTVGVVEISNEFTVYFRFQFYVCEIQKSEQHITTPER